MQPKIKIDALDTNSSVSVDVSGNTDVTLTATQANNGILILTGTLTGDISVIVPDITRRYIVINDTIGAFFIEVRTDLGSGVDAPQGTATEVFSDGTDVRSIDLPPGSNTTAPLNEVVFGTNTGVTSTPYLSYDDTNGQFGLNFQFPATFREFATPGNVRIYAPNVDITPSSSATGGNVLIAGGKGGDTGGSGGALDLVAGGITNTALTITRNGGSIGLDGGSHSASGSVEITAGNMTINTATTATLGGVVITGGVLNDASDLATGYTFGAIELRAGYVNPVSNDPAAGGDIAFFTRDTQSMRIRALGSVLTGRPSLSTTATDGFPYIPVSAGVPTGTPTAETGFAPMVLDSTMDRLYVRSGSAWVDTTTNDGYLSISVAGGSNVTLTAIQAARRHIQLTGLLTANIDLIIPGTARSYTIHNATTGAFTVRVKTSGGTGYYVQQGMRTEVVCDGTDTFELDTTVNSFDGQYGWQDLRGSFIGSRLGTAVNAPTWTTLQGGVSAYAFDDTAMNEVWITFHVPHDYVPGTPIYIHMHWAPTTTDTGVARWGVEYTLAKGYSQAAFPAATTVYLEQAGSGTALQHQIIETSIGDAIPSTNLEVDALIMARVFRDAAHINDTYADPAFGFECDLHYQSTLERTTKNKNFPFS